MINRAVRALYPEQHSPLVSVFRDQPDRHSLDLADVLRTLGRREEAERATQEGLALYRSKGNAAAAREAAALLSH